MKGKIASFRRSRHTTKGNQMILRVDKIDSKEDAEKLVGKKVVWKSPGKEAKEIKGEITAIHGRNGFLRARFEKGMPGQSLGSDVEIQ